MPATDKAVSEALNLYYSGTGTAENPSLSIGGRRGIPLVGRDFTAYPSAPGIEILAVHNTPDGSHTFKVDAEQRTASLVLVDGVHEHISGVGLGVSTVTVGSEDEGFVVARLDTDAMTTVTITIDTVFRLNTLFLNPSPAALQGGETVYRCLYLFNDTAQEVTNVELSVGTDSLDVIEVASEFYTDTSVSAFSARQKPRTTHHKALDPTGWGGVFFAEETPQVYSELSVNSLPIIIATGPTGQATDGDTIQTPMRIEDEHDSAGRLSSLIFGPTIAWARIPPRRGVTFWVRKYTTPTAPGDNTVKAFFTVTSES